jgi:SPP1 gp7 family putative phage head morphogenesis protein
MADPSGTPSSVFKHAINLNRYSNGVSKKIVIAYNRILVNATKELQSMSERDYSSSYRAKRLRQIIGSLKTSLNKWSGDATKLITKDLNELANIESEFALAQLLNEIPDADGIIRELEISPEFAKAVVTKDPTELNLVTTEAGDTLTGKGVYKLTAKQGTPLALPNGDTVEKAFRGIANTSAQKFRLVVQDGMLTGLSTDKIVRQIVGKQGGMRFATGQNVSARAIALAGGEKGTRLANHQVMSLVRTSVNQVSNTASQETYKANSLVTKAYRYVATLDSRTTVLCASKDGKIFPYQEGPMPPLHFNCRSTTVPVIDWDGLEQKYGIVPPEKIEGVGAAKRSSIDGPVPANERYGDWLYSKRVKEGRKVLPGPEQIDALGYDKAVYFNRLAARYKDPNKAIVSLVREDGTEKTLADLRRDYKLKKVDRSIKEATKAIKEEAQRLPTMGELQGFQKDSPLSESDITGVFALMSEMKGQAGENAKKLFQFAEQRQVFCSWSTGQSTKHLLKNPQLRKSLEAAVARGTKGYKGGLKDTVQLLGVSASKEMLGDIDRGRAGKWFKKALTMHGEGLGVGGFTSPGRNNIVLRNRANYKPVKNLKGVIADVKKSVSSAAAGSPLRHTNGAVRGVGTGFFGPQEWITDYVHEMGHQIHYASNKVKLSFRKVLELNSLDRDITTGTWLPSGYGSSNYLEQFAETFVQYIFDPVGLKKVAPEAYKWVDDAMATALKAPK